MTVTATLSVPDAEEAPTVVHLTLSNPTSETQYLARPRIQDDGFDTSCFQFSSSAIVALDGCNQQFPYEDWELVELPAGESLTETINLTGHYLLPGAGHVSVCYSTYHPLNGADGGMEPVESNWVNLPYSDVKGGDIPTDPWWKTLLRLR